MFFSIPLFPECSPVIKEKFKVSAIIFNWTGRLALQEAGGVEEGEDLRLVVKVRGGGGGGRLGLHEAGSVEGEDLWLVPGLLRWEEEEGD